MGGPPTGRTCYSLHSAHHAYKIQSLLRYTGHQRQDMGRLAETTAKNAD